MLQWLVIGIGDITTKRVIPAIQSEPRSSLYGVVTRNPAKAEQFQTRAFSNLQEALADGNFDAVYVATPVFLHAPQTIAALRAGKHVLCEKPMALSYPEALEMQREAAASGKTLGVAYYRRTYPKILRAKELIAAGAIGQPLYAEATCHGWLDGKDTFRAWITDPGRSGGGPLYDIGSHRIDLMNYLFGKPVRVSGHLSNAVHHYSVEDNATVLIDYESHVRGIVDVRWNSKIGRDEFRIRGAEGELELSPLNDPPLVHPGGTEQLPAHANLHYPCVENFVSSILDGKPLLATGASSLWTDWVTEQAMLR